MSLQEVPQRRRVVHQAIPREVLADPALNSAIAALPANYNFEARKRTRWLPLLVALATDGRRPGA